MYVPLSRPQWGRRGGPLLDCTPSLRQANETTAWRSRLWSAKESDLCILFANESARRPVPPSASRQRKYGIRPSRPSSGNQLHASHIYPSRMCLVGGSEFRPRTLACAL